MPGMGEAAEGSKKNQCIWGERHGELIASSRREVAEMGQEGAEEKQREAEGVHMGVQRQTGEAGAVQPKVQSEEQSREGLEEALKALIEREAQTLLICEESAPSHLHFSLKLSQGVAFCGWILILCLVSDCGMKTLCSQKGFQTPSGGIWKKARGG